MKFLGRLPAYKNSIAMLQQRSVTRAILLANGELSVECHPFVK